MHLELMSPGPLETKSLHADSAGGKLSVVPQFWGNGAAANALLVKTFDGQGNMLRTYLLEVSGTNGKLSLVDRTAPVLPKMDSPKKVAAAAEAAKTAQPAPAAVKK